MEFQDVVRKRRMHRKFTDEPVPAEAVDRITRNAVRAPSAGFSQGWAFVVLETAADRDRFWATSTPDTSERDMSAWLAGMRTAPVIVLALASKAAYLRRYAERDKGWEDLDESRWPVPFWHVDVGMASLLMLQTAVDEGLGACFFGVPPEHVGAVRDEFGIPGEFEITGVVAVGHPADGGAKGSPTRRKRKPESEVIHRGGW
ncbi:nitroreductase family protein [Promicromonospora iranensis]|jgi:nitroreductase|uniref:nitroreductase family protein n=1 Tax=Promicromonospora iranensis TaxID=1105144 RepID=UPI0023A9D061|nr:nitroreductase family protein [Promicromonospora iranensis]